MFSCENKKIVPLQSGEEIEEYLAAIKELMT